MLKRPSLRWLGGNDEGRRAGDRGGKGLSRLPKERGQVGRKRSSQGAREAMSWCDLVAGAQR